MVDRPMSGCRTSVIVPVRNGRRVIAGCLEALLDQSLPGQLYEVIVVDDASTDDTADTVARYPVTLLRETSRRGPYAARNRGIEHASGALIALTDADCRPAATWLERGTDGLLDGSADLVGGRVSFTFSNRQSIGELTDALWHLDVERQIARNRCCMTANLLVRREVVEAIGPFDEDVRSGADGRWTRRATDRGFTLRYVSDAEVRKPARTMAPVLRKAYRVGRGLPPAWAERGADRGRIVRGILRQLLPPRVASVREQIERRGTQQMRRRVPALWLATWLLEAVRAAGAVRGLPDIIGGHAEKRRPDVRAKQL